MVRSLRRFALFERWPTDDELIERGVVPPSDTPKRSNDYRVIAPSSNRLLAIEPSAFPRLTPRPQAKLMQESIHLNTRAIWRRLVALLRITVSCLLLPARTANQKRLTIHVFRNTLATATEI